MDFHREPYYVQKALLVIAKLGYFRKEFFFKYLSPDSRSTKFRNWGILIRKDYLEPYKRSFIGEDVYKLSRRGKKLLASAGVGFVSPAHPLHFEHDDHAANLILSLTKQDCIKDAWQTENELRRYQKTENLILFGGQVEKLPDLIFDIPIGEQTFRVAVEVERTRKSQDRYESFVHGYMKTTGINLVLVIYNQKSTFDLISSAIKRFNYPMNERPIAFSKISDLKSHEINFPILVGARVLSLQEYISNLQKLATLTTSIRSDHQSVIQSSSRMESLCG